MKALYASLFILGLVACPAVFAETTLPVPSLGTLEDPARWTHHHVTARAVEVDGRRAAYLISQGDSANGVVGLALPVGLEFETGTLEIELKGKDVRQRSFLGVAFNVADSRTFEAVYFRPFNFKAEPPFNQRAVQYVSWPGNTWEQLRKGHPATFENAVQPVPDPNGWFRARIEVSWAQVRVYVNDAKIPSLVVRRLSNDKKKRPFGLFVDSADGHYAHLTVTPAGLFPAG